MISDVVALAAAHPEPAAYIAAAIGGELWIGAVSMGLRPLEEVAAGAAGLACWYAAARLAIAAGHPAPVIVGVSAIVVIVVIAWILRR